MAAEHASMPNRTSQGRTGAEEPRSMLRGSRSRGDLEAGQAVGITRNRHATRSRRDAVRGSERVRP